MRNNSYQSYQKWEEQKNCIIFDYKGSMSDADAAMVKVFCSEMLNKIADDAVQIFGGMGLMDSFPLSKSISVKSTVLPREWPDLEAM